MNAQKIWNEYFIDFLSAVSSGHEEDAYVIRCFMRDIRREAALERKLEAAQRKIETQDQRIGKLESMLILYMDGLPTGPSGYTRWPVAPLHDQARNMINR